MKIDIGSGMKIGFKIPDVINPAKTIPQVWHLAWFMLGFMTMIFSIVILPLGSPHPRYDTMMGLIGAGLVIWNAKSAIHYTPVSLGCFIFVFGVAIVGLGVSEFVWYANLVYHTEHWNKFCFAVGFTAAMGISIMWFGVDFIIRQMKKQGFLIYDEATKQWKVKHD